MIKWEFELEKEIMHALEILSKLAYARSESDYNQLYDVRMHMIVCVYRI